MGRGRKAAGSAARCGELFLDMNALALNKPALTQEERGPRPMSASAQINTPTLLMVGDEDFTALIERHEHLSEEMPNAFAVVLEGVAHIPSIERPDLVNPLLLEFLDAVIGEGEDEEETD